MNPILMAIILVTVIGLIGAVILVAASIVMYVPVDERVEQITGVLAGANCGRGGWLRDPHEGGGGLLRHLRQDLQALRV